MRIVQISTDRLPCPPKYGSAIEEYIFYISKGLSKRGHETHIISLDKKENTYKREGVYFHTFTLETSSVKLISNLFVPISRVNKYVPYLTYKIMQILRKIERECGKIDVIHAHYFTTCFAPILFKKIFNKECKLVLHLHNIPKPNRINKLISEQYDVLVAVSNYLKSRALENLSIDDKKIKVIYNAVDTNFFRFDPESRKKVREKLGLRNSEVVLLFIGRIVREKGLHHVVQALAKVMAQYPQIILLIVGPKGHFDIKDESYYNEVMSLARKLNVSDKMIYLGQLEREKIPQIYSASDIVVVPQIWEEGTLGLTVLEAMACQRTVVTYDLGAIREALDDEIGGLSKPNPDSLAKKILEMLFYKNLHDIGLKSRNRIYQRFSLNTLIESLIRVYEDKA